MLILATGVDFGTADPSWPFGTQNNLRHRRHCSRMSERDFAAGGTRFFRGAGNWHGLDGRRFLIMGRETLMHGGARRVGIDLHEQLADGLPSQSLADGR